MVAIQWETALCTLSQGRAQAYGPSISSPAPHSLKTESDWEGHSVEEGGGRGSVVRGL